MCQGIDFVLLVGKTYSQCMSCVCSGDVGDCVTEKCAPYWRLPKGGDRPRDEMMTRLEQGRVGFVSRRDEVDAVGEAVGIEVSIDCGARVVADDGKTSASCSPGVDQFVRARCRLRPGDGLNFMGAQRGFYKVGLLSAKGACVPEDDERIFAGLDLGRPLSVSVIGQRLAKLICNLRSGQVGEHCADRTVEVEEEYPSPLQEAAQHIEVIYLLVMGAHRWYSRDTVSHMELNH